MRTKKEAYGVLEDHLQLINEQSEDMRKENEK